MDAANLPDLTPRTELIAAGCRRAAGRIATRLRHGASVSALRVRVCSRNRLRSRAVSWHLVRERIRGAGERRCPGIGAAAAREAGNLKDALALYREGVEARPDWDEGRWYVATLLYEMDRYADAREAFVDVLRRQPTHAGALGLKGLCEFELRRYDRALADLLEAGNIGRLAVARVLPRSFATTQPSC